MELFARSIKRLEGSRLWLRLRSFRQYTPNILPFPTTPFLDRERSLVRLANLAILVVAKEQQVFSFHVARRADQDGWHVAPEGNKRPSPQKGDPALPQRTPADRLRQYRKGT